MLTDEPGECFHKWQKKQKRRKNLESTIEVNESWNIPAKFKCHANSKIHTLKNEIQFKCIYTTKGEYKLFCTAKKNCEIQFHVNKDKPRATWQNKIQFTMHLAAFGSSSRNQDLESVLTEQNVTFPI